jgi:hypothetical protein
MATTIREQKADPYDRSLCFVVLWERGFRAAALNECMDAARTMATMRTANEKRKEKATCSTLSNGE